MALCGGSRQNLQLAFKIIPISLLFFLALSSPISYATQPAPCDLVLLNGTIATVDARNPDAQALAVRGDRISAVGTNEKIRRFIGPSTRVLDLSGKFAMPGFIDGHAHLGFFRPVQAQSGPFKGQQLG